MSGVDPSALAPIVAAGFFFTIGAINLFVPATPAAPPGWLIEARMRYGGDINLPTPRPTSVGWDRVGGICMILLGAMQLFPHRGSVFDRTFLLFAGGFLLLMGMGILIARLRWPSAKDETWPERRQRRKFEQRVARGSDAYFEELRSILSQDPPPRRARYWEVVSTGILVFFGGAMLALGLMMEPAR